MRENKFIVKFDEETNQYYTDHGEKKKFWKVFGSLSLRQCGLIKRDGFVEMSHKEFEHCFLPF